MRHGLILKCEVCKKENYIADRNKKTKTTKLAIKKYCEYCKKHILHKEKN